MNVRQSGKNQINDQLEMNDEADFVDSPMGHRPDGKTGTGNWGPRKDQHQHPDDESLMAIEQNDSEIWENIDRDGIQFGSVEEL